MRIEVENQASPPRRLHGLPEDEDFALLLLVPLVEVVSSLWLHVRRVVEEGVWPLASVAQALLRMKQVGDES